MQTIFSRADAIARSVAKTGSRHVHFDTKDHILGKEDSITRSFTFGKTLEGKADNGSNAGSGSDGVSATGVGGAVAQFTLPSSPVRIGKVRPAGDGDLAAVAGTAAGGTASAAAASGTAPPVAGFTFGKGDTKQSVVGPPDIAGLGKQQSFRFPTGAGGGGNAGAGAGAGTNARRPSMPGMPDLSALIKSTQTTSRVPGLTLPAMGTNGAIAAAGPGGKLPW